MNGSTVTTNRLVPPPPTRLPGQPATQPHVAPPRAAPPSRLPPVANDADGQFGRILTYLQLHWLTVVFAGALLGAALAYLAYTLLPPKYESYALFQVASIPSSITGTDPTRSKTDFATYLKTQASLFKYEFVYSAALRDSRLGDLETIKKQKDPFKYFDEELLVETKDGSEIVRLSLKGDQPDEIRRIVDAIKDAYMKEVIQKEKESKNELRLDLQRAKADLETIMGQKVIRFTNSNPQQDPNKPSDPAVPQNPMPGQPPANGNPVGNAEMVQRARFPILVQKVARLEGEIPQLTAQISVKKADLDAAKKGMQALLDTPISAESAEQAKKDESYLKAESYVNFLKNELRFLSNTLQANSERITVMQRRVESAEQEAKQILDSLAKTIESNKRKPLFGDVNQSINNINRDLIILNEQKTLAETQLVQAKKELAEIPPTPAEVKTLTGQAPQRKETPDPNMADYLTHEKLYERVTSQLIATEYDLKLPPRVRVIQSATSAMQKDTKKQIIATVFAGLLGFILIGALAVAYEMKVRKISSLADLKSAGPPVVGVLPWMPTVETARDPIKRADINEGIDKLRAYVVQTWLSRGATTVTVTSTVGDEGKAFAAFGLASSLAQAGYRTLLVDFDLRQPSLHQLAGVKNEIGVCDLLRGDRELREAIQTLPSGLCLLTSGAWSDEARQAAVGTRFEALLSRIKEPFDCVVLHSHALLTVAETVEVARRSEVVLMCALYRETRLAYMKRAAERIATMEIPYSGIVYLGATKHEALC